VPFDRGAQREESGVAVHSRSLSPLAWPNSTHSTTTRNGFPFSTTYVASSAALPLPTFRTAWTVSAATSKTSPASSVVGGLTLLSGLRGPERPYSCRSSRTTGDTRPGTEAPPPNVDDERDGRRRSFERPTRRRLCSQQGQQKMKPLWSPVVATGGNRSQMAPARKPRKQAKTVAMACDRLP
jgi:hypothetical protein